jgi:alkylhydroperoxidase family enzyme
MTGFPLHDPASAPPEARTFLERAAQNFGSVPNLERVMASAPALLAGYVSLWDLFETTSLTPIERNVVYQTANVENGCIYCVPWHTWLCRSAGLPEAEVQALRDGSPLSDPHLEALRTFTRVLVLSRGKVLRADLERFLAVGFSERHALEVVLGIAVKVMSNYTNSLAGTPLDARMAAHAWERPVVGMRPT